MIDFVEYVVSELSSKRLSKSDALGLLSQYRARTAAAASGSILHPLVHRNVSDLAGQCYATTLAASAPWLRDHRVDGRCVLPGVAYLEMVRAAVAAALPDGAGRNVELANVVWAQPIVVADSKDVSIALFPHESAAGGLTIEYEVTSAAEPDAEIVHSQGLAIVTEKPAPAKLDLTALEREMSRGTLEAAQIYAAYERIGISYGAAHRGVVAVRRGERQLLAELRLPAAADAGFDDFVLHPSLLDAAVQAAIGFLDDLDGAPQRPSLPFALDALRLLAPCTRDVFVWLRPSQGNSVAGRVQKLDIDLADATGNVCVQMRGFTSRTFAPQRTVTADTDLVGTTDGAQERDPDAPPDVAVGRGTDVSREAPDEREAGTASVERPAAENAGDLLERTRTLLKRRLSAVLKLPPSRIDTYAPFEKYGIDSIMTTSLTNELEHAFGSLPKTLFFEYQTLDELAQYFVRSHAGRLAALLDGANAAGTTEKREKQGQTPESDPVFPNAAGHRRRRRIGVQTRAAHAPEPIAIVGLSGRYPGARDVEAYWRNLRDGKDCIAEVPRERWDWREYFSADRTRPGRHYSKWGGFIDGVDEFDPLFFAIPPVDADRIDPQERLFLQHAWNALEDAGITRASLQRPHDADQPGQVGVYVGVMYGEYQLFGAEASLRGERTVTPVSYSSIANRVSYFLNLHGPSMAIDTMCSSSLTAIHLACEDLKHGRTDAAIAGGVNVTVHPNKYLLLSGGQFIASGGRCESFGEGGDGYIPSEGVGVVVLKRLADAERDGNHVYALIKGSALNHGGKTNGYSVPNPQAQASVIHRAFREHGIDPRRIGYVEAHGTGTKLGDPIEIAALTQAFRYSTQDCQFCSIGSAKSNIGHCESAAGVAGLTKVLLQLKHRKIVPSLHSTALNPNIDFASTPFTVNQTLRDWEAPLVDGRRLPRLAGLSSFGAGGSNAHLIIEEYEPFAPPVHEAAEPVAIVLSAKTPEQLRQRARDLVDFIRAHDGPIDSRSLAYTLQVGREPMEERLALVAGTLENAVEKLERCLDGHDDQDDCFRGRPADGGDLLALIGGDADLQATVDRWIAARKLAKLAELWSKGLAVDWRKLYDDPVPRAIPLPGYPFARDRYWFDRTLDGRALGGEAAAALHPLVHVNTSDFTRQGYRSTFTGGEHFLADHRVTIGGTAAAVLPAAAYLEMARAAIEHAWPCDSSAAIELRDVAFARPLVVDARRDVEITLAAGDDDTVAFEIFTEQAGEPSVHCEGRALVGDAADPIVLDLDALDRQMQRGALEPAALYALYERFGLGYGPAHRAIAAIACGEGQLVARLELPPVVRGGGAAYGVHPSLLDGALQAALGLVEGPEPDAAHVPFAVSAVRILAPCPADLRAWVRYSPGSGPGDDVVKIDIDLAAGDGRVCVQLRELSSRALAAGGDARANDAAAGTLLAVPSWEPADAVADHDAVAHYVEHHVVVCELPEIDAGTLERALPGSRCRGVRAPAGTLAERYRHHALAGFELVRDLLAAPTHGRVLVQFVVPSDRDDAVLAGLSGLLRSAALENPRLFGQMVLIAPGTTTEALAQILSRERRSADTLIKHDGGRRTVERWRELPAADDARTILEDDGAYLITGGLGGLGVLFAKELLAHTTRATVVLTGRSALSDERRTLLATLAEAGGGRVEYRVLDVENLEQTTETTAALAQAHGRVTGILHCAGTTADSFILRKSAAELERVLGPKVTGTFNLDAATRELDLRWFVLFASISGAMGNVGQADYAAANGFMDRFAAYRNALVAAGERRGRTVAVDWPLWSDGGMQIDAATRAIVERATGMQPLRTASGLAAFHRALALPDDRLLVVEGRLDALRRTILGAAAEPPLSATPAPPAAAPPHSATAQPAATTASHSATARLAATLPPGPAVAQPAAASAPARTPPAEPLLARAESYLREQLSASLRVPAHKIDPRAPLENYGIDSVLAMRLTNDLERTFGPLSKTLFFEYQTLDRLAGYLVASHPEVIARVLGEAHAAAATPAVAPQTQRARTAASARAKRFGNPGRRRERDVAIVGLSGRYPQAESLAQFWDNLRAGRDCITEVPADRWDHSQYFDPQRGKAGKTYAKWGGFLADVDKFDPLFFNISPKEAEIIDPQERLFLQTAWHAFEDAGYGKASLAGRRAGVYVGAMWSQYELYGTAALGGAALPVPTSSHASIANRVSYFFDLHGPSIAVDTMCSSSLTAIHLAAQEIRRGEIDLALAGGVNLSIHPQKYLNLAQGNFAASDGRCRAFGAGGDGYVPGEGVGAVVLKPLEAALADGDHVYAVIKASALNHGGKTNGYTVPNPVAQSTLIRDALMRGGVDPRTLDYVEAHGTGTSLGDPIEITGLREAFAGFTLDEQFCAIGSIKSNIGHLESAAGIAALTKVLLQLEHGTLVPSLHAEPANPHIDFERSPFRVQTELAAWPRREDRPRRAAISAFGAGGSNAHLIVEEYVDGVHADRPAPPPAREAFLLSARDRDALVRYAQSVAAFVAHGAPPLRDIAYTSQVGRTPLAVRLAVLASSAAELEEKLAGWIAAQQAGDVGEIEDVCYGNVNDPRYGAGQLIGGAAGRAFLDALIENGELDKAARLWTCGADIDWAAVRRGERPRRVSLPGYPFAKERFWIDGALAAPRAAARVPHGSPASPLAIEPLAATYYRPEWVTTPLASSATFDPAGPILVLDEDEAFARALRAKLAAGGVAAPVVLAKLAASYGELAPDSFTIDGERSEDFARLADALAGTSGLPRVILHRYPNRDAAHEPIAASLDRGVLALLELCKTLMRRRHDAPTRMLSFFGGALLPLGEALAGFYRTLNLEHPKYVAKVVEIVRDPGDADAAIADQVDLVHAELCDERWATQEVRYARDPGAAGWQRRVRGLFAAAPDAAGELPLKQRGVYLITGGLGGLGSLLAEDLARRCQARLALVGRGAPNEAQAKKIEHLAALGAEVLHVRGDVAVLADVRAMIDAAKARFGRIDGVIHAAGVHRDAFILKKSRTEAAEVLAAKVQGTVNLDLATADEDLDLFALFSSVAGVFGNVGQCDYAYGNRFLDAFAERRERSREAGSRSGRTLAVGWPYWQDGGMPLAREAVAALSERAGLHPLPNDVGLQYWDALLRSTWPCAVALYGAPAKIAAYLEHRAAATPAGGADAAIGAVGQATADAGGPAAAGADTAGADPAGMHAERAAAGTVGGAAAAAALAQRARRYLKTLIGREIKLEPERIDAHERLESFGIDSITVGRLNDAMSRDLGELPKTLFYEYESIEELAHYLAREVPGALARVSDGSVEADAASARSPAAHDAVAPHDDVLPRDSVLPRDDGVAPRDDVVPHGEVAPHDGALPRDGALSRAGAPARNAAADEPPEPIAIVGIHGRYPGAESLAELWDALRAGQDAVAEVPRERWDWQAFYDPDPERAADGKIYCKWGAFLSDADKFDAPFFNIAADEARSIDPQERLFLQSVWAALEDAGYTRETLKSRYPKGRSADVGVFVGVTTNSYQMLEADDPGDGGDAVTPSALPWSIANRVSYFFDFQGPSIPIDTACSSSLVAIHLACESLRRRECAVAVAGGVNLYLHPAKYRGLCRRRMLARHGRCRSFGAGDDGFVPGEGVGTLILKPLRRALEEGDHVHAVIRASAYDHAGRSNGYSAPNPGSQARLIGRVLDAAGIAAESIGYVEGHGTGTQLGDSIEVAALSQAFRARTARRQFCALGSVKANLGHSESAAGVAGVSKIVLQLAHRQLAPTIHAEDVNPSIDFEHSPCRLQTELGAWEPTAGAPRRALVNSFGAGGVNACVLLEEHAHAAPGPRAARAERELVVLSARDDERLAEQVRQLLAYVRERADLDLEALAHTLQVGREAMTERLAVAAASTAELIEKLERWQRTGHEDGVHRGRHDPRQTAKAPPAHHAAAQRDLDALARAWVGGAEVDWQAGRAGDDPPPRIPLPTYPFARQRYWVSDPAPPQRRAPRVRNDIARLHPLVAYNSSTLHEVSFRSLLSEGRELPANDHRIDGRAVFPGAGFLEIACVAGTLAATRKVRRMEDIVFARPLVLEGSCPTLDIALRPSADRVEYVITSLDADRERVVHSEGVLLFEDRSIEHAAGAELPIDALLAQCGAPVPGARYYELFEQAGIAYGPTYRTIETLHVGDSFALAKLAIPDRLRAGFDQFVLHPCIVDGALQAVAGLVDGAAPAATPYVPFAIEEVVLVRPLAPSGYVHVTEVGRDARSRADVRKFDIEIASESGAVLASLKRFCVRALPLAQPAANA